jgi:long-chain acyl-CoA synthetase
MSTLRTLWEDTERRNPEKIGVITNGIRLTYREMGNRIRSLSTNMASNWNIGSGTIVALYAPNCSEFVIAYFAATFLGAIVQPVDERMTPEEVKVILDDSRARFLVVHCRLWDKFGRVRSKLSRLERILGIGIEQNGVDRFEDWALGAKSTPIGSTIRADTIAELMYTSGSSGEPKPVMRTHRNALAGSRNALRGFGYREDDVIAIGMPLSHSSAITSQMLPLIGKGGTLVLLDRFDAGLLLDTVKSEAVTCMRAVPTMLRLLLSNPAFFSDMLPSLRLLVNSSAAIDPETYREVKRRFSGIEVMNSYGLTEASTCTVLPDVEALKRTDSVGYAIEGVEMCLLDDEGKMFSTSGTGEICIRGEHVFVGYRNRPKETEAAFHSGWLRTGDMGRLDSDGFYYIIGRKQDMINCGGRKFSPVEVENVVMQMPDVVNAAAVGIPHRVLGQVVKVFVVAQKESDLSPKLIKNHCASRLPSHKVPFYVDIALDLPVNAAGKVLRRKLLEKGDN